MGFFSKMREEKENKLNELRSQKAIFVMNFSFGLSKIPVDKEVYFKYQSDILADIIEKLKSSEVMFKDPRMYYYLEPGSMGYSIQLSYGVAVTMYHLFDLKRFCDDKKRAISELSTIILIEFAAENSIFEPIKETFWEYESWICARFTEKLNTKK